MKPVIMTVLVIVGVLQNPFVLAADIIECKSARLTVQGVERCTSTRPSSNNQGYGAFAYYGTGGSSAGYYFNLVGFYPVGPTSSINSASDENVDRLLKNFHNDTKQAEKWGPVERTTFGRVVHFRPAVKGQSCAGIFVDGPYKDMGVAWQYFGYICTSGTERLSDNQLSQAVGMISSR